MVLAFGNKRIELKKICSYISVIYVLNMSGSVLQYMNMSMFQTINMIITLGLFMVLLIRRRVSFRNLDIVKAFILLSLMSVFIVPVLWGEISIIHVYVAYFCLLLMPWLLTQIIDYQDFKDTYMNIMLLIALLSLIFYIFPKLLLYMPHLSLGRSSSWDYDYYFVYAKYADSMVSVLQRNIGIFWEPGMFQGFILVAMILRAITPKNNNSGIFYQIIMAICILTIQSTTGFILLLPVLLIYILRAAERYSQTYQIIVTILIFLAVFAVLWNEEFLRGMLNAILPDIVSKLDLKNNISGSTRLYSLLGDALLALRNPFGVGIGHMSSEKNNILIIFNSMSSGASTNTSLAMMLYYGLIPGVLYFVIFIKGTFRLTNNRLINISVFIVLLIIINTEPHYLTLFFSMLFFYHAQLNRYDFVENSRNSALN